MKNNFLPRLLAASALLLAASCQKVVTLNLKDSARSSSSKPTWPTTGTPAR
ncbi:hypothetical protein [Hymenobacter sp. BRD67]|uniref:hypothetical protein n=1 Tax=Hymenobacter sp. BRD67 TaxID=2675877 RepID=UPI001565F7A7|nr:hypothetical protein [Hymenobacter sp. BRD67]QKG53048.1 hypothetical protein GKZ67_11085 [Hymenobacter sp. BRD67]